MRPALTGIEGVNQPLIKQRGMHVWTITSELVGEVRKSDFALKKNSLGLAQFSCSSVRKGNMSETINCLFACYLQTFIHCLLLTELPSCLISADSIAHSRLVIPG